MNAMLLLMMLTHTMEKILYEPFFGKCTTQMISSIDAYSEIGLKKLKHIEVY